MKTNMDNNTNDTKTTQELKEEEQRKKTFNGMTAREWT